MARWSSSAVVLVALVGLVGIPLYQLGRVGTEDFTGIGPDTLHRAVAGSAVFNTAWTGIVVALIAVAAGVWLAFVTERWHPIRSGWLRVAIMLPIVVPGFVSALGFVGAFATGGLSDDLAGFAVPGVFGPLGIVTVLSIEAMPLAYLIVVAALRSRAEPDLERAARVHGASGRVAATTVVLPLLAPALLGSAALVFVASINAFGAPAVLGTPAGFATVTTRIYQDLARSARPEAFSRAVLLALLLVAVALVFVLAAERLLTGMGTITRTGEPPGQVIHRHRGRRAAVVAWVVVLVATVLPLVSLVLTALTRAVGLTPTPANWTTANFAEAFQGRFAGALGRSLLLSVVAATIVMALGAAVTALRHRRVGRLARTAVLLTFAVPGSTLAVAILLAYGASLRGTLALILVAYLAKLWGIGHRIIEGSAAAIPPDLYRAARAGGASGWTATRTVTAPLLAPAILGGGLLVFSFAFHELTMSSLLYGPGTDTLAVVVLNLQQLGDVPASAALAVLLTVPLLLMAIPLLAGRWRGGP